MEFHTREEQDQYRNILMVLSEPGPSSDALRIEAMRLFTIFDIPDRAIRTPNKDELNKAYDRALRTRTLSHSIPSDEVNASPYLNTFFQCTYCRVVR